MNLCPTTCQEIQGDGGAQLFVEFPCELSFETTIYSQVYTADCEPGSIVEWRALGYDTSIEGNGSVEFEVRTAVEEDELDAADYVSVNTATSTSPDCVYLEPMECVASDPDCTCVAVDGQSEGIGGGVALVGNVLDSVAAHEPYLELKMTVLPDEEEMASPSVLDWKVAYSCLPGE